MLTPKSHVKFGTSITDTAIVDGEECQGAAAYISVNFLGKTAVNSEMQQTMCGQYRQSYLEATINSIRDQAPLPSPIAKPLGEMVKEAMQGSVEKDKRENASK